MDPREERSDCSGDGISERVSGKKFRLCLRFGSPDPTHVEVWFLNPLSVGAWRPSPYGVDESGRGGRGLVSKPSVCGAWRPSPYGVDESGRGPVRSQVRELPRGLWWIAPGGVRSRTLRLDLGWNCRRVVLHVFGRLSGN